MTRHQFNSRSIIYESNAPDRWMKFVAAPLLGVLVGLAGCQDPAANDDSSSRMRMSTGEFQRGMEDGNRDAQMSIFEDHAAWWWLWMAEPEYQSGYENGWKQGRMQAKLEARQETRNRELEESANDPAPPPSE